MKNVDQLVPNLTKGVITKILFVEIYFLLRSGQSPAYFSLLDFVDSYSLELLYITTLLTLLTGWMTLPAIAGYVIIAGSLSLIGRLILSPLRCFGIPIFKALRDEEREKRVSVKIAESFAHSNSNSDLQKRIDAHLESSNQHLANEVLASANFVLILAIAWVSHSTSAPNFMMKVTNFVDPHLAGHAYEICLALLIIQGLLGRASNFHSLSASGYLPTRFFKNEDERLTVAAWSSSEVQKHYSLAEKWLNR
ncbi:MAG: hypothetical protein VXZ18_05275 [Pseudomonadota bacterium]|nr:hypothetical protein [Pseudomonadota bacterium]